MKTKIWFWNYRLFHSSAVGPGYRLNLIFYINGKQRKKKAKNRRPRLKPHVLCFPRAAVDTSVWCQNNGLDIDTASCKGSLHLEEEKRERLIKSTCPFVSHTHRTGGLLSGIGRQATPQLPLPSADTFNRLLRRRAGRLCSHIKASQGCPCLDGPTLPFALWNAPWPQAAVWLLLQTGNPDLKFNREGNDERPQSFLRRARAQLDLPCVL